MSLYPDGHVVRTHCVQGILISTLDEPSFQQAAQEEVHLIVSITNPNTSAMLVKLVIITEATSRYSFIMP